MNNTAALRGPRPRRPVRRLLGSALGLVAVCGVLGANVPTVGAALSSWYHNYRITRPAYQQSTGSGPS